MATTEEKITFEGASGVRLVGRLHHPETPPIAWALFAHCFTCSKDLRAARALTACLARRGVATLRFDFTGLGESEGDFADTNFSSNVDDLVAAAAWLEAHHSAPTLLVGHSLGGAAVIAAAPRIASSKAVVALGAPADPSHVLHLLDGVADRIEEDGQARVHLAGRPFTVKAQFLHDVRQQALGECLAELGRALLILHSPQDRIVGIHNAAALYRAARHPKSFVSLDGADHLLSRVEDAFYAGEVAATWATRYLPPPPELPEEGVATHGEVVVECGRERYRQTVRAGPHRIVSDEPKRAGGADLGPTPYDLLLASLGSCTNMTLRMYADRTGWPLDAVRTTLTHRRVHARDCEDCDDHPRQIAQITRVIALEGDLDASQRERLAQIADRCPVHRTLHSEIRVDTRLEE